MEPRELPGFYYDKERKKYFAITPDHEAQHGAKYTQSHVRSEQRAAKRLKEARVGYDASHVNQSFLQTQRTDSLLYREHGLCLRSQGVEAGQRAYISLLECTRFPRSPPWPRRGERPSFEEFLYPLLGVHLLPSRDRVLVRSDTHLQLVNPNLTIDASHGTVARSVHYHDHANRNLAIVYGGSMDTPYTLLHNFDKLASGLRYHIVKVDVDDNEFKIEHVRLSNLPRKTRLPDYVWSCARAPDGKVAFGTSEGLILMQSNLTALEQRRLRCEATVCDWMDNNILATSQDRSLMLSDVRTNDPNDSAVRFRSERFITGVKAVSNGTASQLLVSNDKRLMLYDTRMSRSEQDKYVLSFASPHVGPRARFDVNQHGEVIAYANSRISIASLSTGTIVRRLDVNIGHSVVPAQIEWQEDMDGAPVIQLTNEWSLDRWSLPLVAE